MGVACYQESVIGVYEGLKDGEAFVSASDAVFMVVDAGRAGWSCPECVSCLCSTRELCMGGKFPGCASVRSHSLGFLQ